MKSDLPPIILLDSAVIDREARLIIERDPDTPGRIWLDNGQSKYFYDGDDARKILSFYFGEGDWR